MRKAVLFVLLLAAVGAAAQTPTLIQDVNCPNSGDYGSGTGNTYTCALPEPVSATGNIVLIGIFSGNTSNSTVADDKSDTITNATAATDSDSNRIEVWYTYATAGTRTFTITPASTGGYVSVHLSEYFNVGALDTKNCHTATSSSTSITAGSITPTASGDLLWQIAENDTVASVASFTASTQSNWAASLNKVSIHDGFGAQAGIYSSTAAINPTLTAGTSKTYDSCVMALKPATAGGAPSARFRIVGLLHEQMVSGQSSPQAIQFPTSGNHMIAISFEGGNIAMCLASGNPSGCTSGISSSPSNAWASTGTASDATASVPQIFYVCSANTSNAMTISIPFEGPGPPYSTYLVYEIAGAAPTSCLDTDSGVVSGNQTSIVSSLTTCSACVTTSSASGELILGNFGQNDCTATAVTAPSGGLFDAAVYTGNNYNGPQNVDQNNGWFHAYSTSGSMAITSTYSESCSGEAEDEWYGRVAAFRPAASTRRRAWVTQ